MQQDKLALYQSTLEKKAANQLSPEDIEACNNMYQDLDRKRD